ncbi:MAG: hypothetical protein ACI9UA_000607 [Pseudoalteromonas tetraodonis]|jgi:hypothetical protein
MRAIQYAAAALLLLVTCRAEEQARAGLDWWAFQQVVRPDVPKTTGPSANPIDAFVRAQLAQHSMTPAPAAARRTLIRRLHFDLTGLPPTFDEIEAFVASNDPKASENLIDQLLASPHFGERWARHWLDVVRYAETNGYERDAVKPNIWKYRDWVIDAFNSDMPYDRFVREQLAGDEIPDRSESSVIATGMLRAGTWNDEPNDPQEYKYERLEDMVDVVSTAFLGVTAKCARCHDHKFDPIPQRDYYRLAAAFWPGAIEPRDGALMGGPKPDELGHKDVFGWTDLRRDPPPFHLLINGDPQREGDVVEPGHLSLAPALDHPLATPPDGSRSTLRRLQLAQFIGHRRNPLAARVMVNRIWQHLIGKGIVRTPNNFGFKSAPPTHPQLLDWLAADFMDSGWTIKRLIRQIVLSATYQQASVHPREDAFAQKDSGNHLLWRMDRRRADAEALRDALLHTSGEINLRRGGPSFYPVMAPEVLEGFSRKSSAWTTSPEEERLRRSVYMVSKRHLLLPIMTAFDFPNSEKPCGKRDVTTVVPQSLAMLNNHFVHARSDRLAGLASEQSDSAEGAIRFAWRKALGRDPTEAELASAFAHYEQQRDHFRPATVESRPAAPAPTISKQKLVLRLSASDGITLDGDGRIASWSDRSGQEHHASQPDAKRRPSLSRDAINGEPALRFSGNSEFLHLAGSVVRSQTCTIIAVASDRSNGATHREIFSNWDGAAGNSVNSLFLGLTGKGAVRFSDNFLSGQKLEPTSQPFLLVATNGSVGANIFHNGVQIATRPNPLTTRRLDTPFVIGQQGNIQGEYWNGDIAELLVYERQLDDRDLASISVALAQKYAIPLEPGAAQASRNPEMLALASVCHVLLNSNEFLYVD